MARPKIRPEDLMDLDDCESNDPYLSKVLSRFEVAGEFDDEY